MDRIPAMGTLRQRSREAGYRSDRPLMPLEGNKHSRLSNRERLDIPSPRDNSDRTAALLLQVVGLM